MTELERLLSQDDGCLVSVASVKRALNLDTLKEYENNNNGLSVPKQYYLDGLDKAYAIGYQNAIDNVNSRNALKQDPTNTIDYRRAFKIACDLLNGDVLYGVDTDKIYELMMQKDEVVSSSSYEEYILNHLQELDQGELDKESVEPTTKSNSGVDCAKCKQEILDLVADNDLSMGQVVKGIHALIPVTPQEPIHMQCNQCKYYEGVHNVQGLAPCSYHNIVGGVLWNWYCSQFESEDKDGI